MERNKSLLIIQTKREEWRLQEPVEETKIGKQADCCRGVGNKIRGVGGNEERRESCVCVCVCV